MGGIDVWILNIRAKRTEALRILFVFFLCEQNVKNMPSLYSPSDWHLPSQRIDKCSITDVSRLKICQGLFFRFPCLPCSYFLPLSRPFGGYVSGAI